MLHCYRFRNRHSVDFSLDKDWDTQGHWVYYCADDNSPNNDEDDADSHPISSHQYLPGIDCYQPAVHELHYLGDLAIDDDGDPLEGVSSFLSGMGQGQGFALYYLQILEPLKRRILLLLAQALKDKTPFWVKDGGGEFEELSGETNTEEEEELRE